MRVLPGALLLVSGLAGCVFQPFEEPPAPQISAAFSVTFYDSDANDLTDGIKVVLSSARKTPGAEPIDSFVGNEFLLLRDGDANVSFFADPERVRDRVRTLDVGKPLYILGYPGSNLITVNLSKTFTYKERPFEAFLERDFSVPVQELRDTEVDGVLEVQPYDHDANGRSDGLQMELRGSTRAPSYALSEVRVEINGIRREIFSDGSRAPETELQDDDSIRNGVQFFVAGQTGENRLEVAIRATVMIQKTFTLSEAG